MKKTNTLLLLLFVNLGFAQADLFVSNNVNVYIYVDGTGFDDTIANVAPLFVTNNIELAGVNSIIYLRNEAQLLQLNDVNNTGIGYLERGQRGSASLYNYNYWGSPVWSDTNSYALDDILFNGTDPNNVLDIQWSSAYDADYSTSPITMSSYWLYTYDDNIINDYDTWEPKDENSLINDGLGFTMKGSGSGNGSQLQNYMFRGIPNNGSITNSVDDGNQTLVGNPYPSAIDAREFIKDNIPLLLPNGNPSQANSGSTTSITGTLLFWRQSTAVNTHYLAVYQGGYAQLTLAGGNAAASFPSEIGGIGDAGNDPLYRPGFYIPVAQGFFVDADPAAVLPILPEGPEPIRFKNSQRFFKKEAPLVSVFLEPHDASENIRSNNQENPAENIDDIQRVRLAFKTPEGAFRYLLLAFTQNNEATDEFDYGYEAENFETLPSDLNWAIDDKNYTIQGVGKFNTDKVYPLNMVLGEKGNVEITLTELENFNEEIEVFVYDSYLKTYTNLNAIDYSNNLDAYTYNDRFFIAFKESDDTLNINEETLENIQVNYLSDSKEIYVRMPKITNIKEIQLLNIVGQTVKSWNNSDFQNNTAFKIPVNNISEGTYLIKLNSHSGTINKKVIINQN